VKRQSHCNPLQHTANTATAGSATVQLQCVAVVKRQGHCNTLQHTATHCNTLQHTATAGSAYGAVYYCNTLQHTATHCNTLQQTATHCNSLQQNAGSANGAVYYGTLGGRDAEYECCHGTLCCSVLQCVAVCCSVLQGVAACCSILLHPEGKRR